MKSDPHCCLPQIPLRWLLLLLVPLSGVSRADIYTVRRQGSTIVPQKSTEVSMDAETVVIEPKEEGEYFCTATFWMRNQSASRVESTVAFPVAGQSAGYSANADINRQFTVAMKSEGKEQTEFASVPAELKKNTPSGKPAGGGGQTGANFDYPECIVWAAAWEPGETKVIRLTYEMGAAGILPGSNRIAAGQRLLYVVRTGALWKGPIGKADISIQYRGDPWDANVRGQPEDLTNSYPQQARWVRPDLVQWHFENWQPDEDIWVQSTAWAGLTDKMADNYFFALPADYRGAKESYTTEMIEALVKDELKFSREHYPEKAAGVDQKLLQKVVADWLYHELFARHGDPFMLGKVEPGKKPPADSVASMDGYYVSRWQSKFIAYHYHGGWYNPKFGPDGAVQFKDLSPMEQRNAEFLRGYINARTGR